MLPVIRAMHLFDQEVGTNRAMMSEQITILMVLLLCLEIYIVSCMCLFVNTVLLGVVLINLGGGTGQRRTH